MDGMDMGSSSSSSSSSMSGMQMMMKPYLHFTPGDALWLMEWTPTSPGAVFGACLGLFFLAIVERLLLAMKGVMESWWKRKADAMLARQLLAQRPASPPSNCCDDEKEKGTLSDNEGSSSSASSVAASPPRVPISRVLPPFILSHDITRAAITTARAAIGYIIMLAVMTFNVSFILSILIGTFSGELLFGRFTALVDGHHP